MSLIPQIYEKTGAGDAIDRRTALEMESIKGDPVFELLPAADRLRKARSQNRVNLCSIINAKSGQCSEDCGFCAQSARYETNAPVFALLSPSRIRRAAKDSAKNRARRFSVVTSGKGVSGESEIASISESIAAVKAEGLLPCASPGIVDDRVLERWQEAGLQRYHHNLETSRSFFGQVCTTHDYEEDVQAVRRAGALGLEVCSGGIFGMGESWQQRVELAFDLKDLEVDAVPLNFYHPIAGTPLAKTAPGVTPLDALKTIALFRLCLPETELIVCGGRGPNLRDLQSYMFLAGADGLMIGNYLTTAGRPAREDLKMLDDLALEPT